VQKPPSYAQPAVAP